MGGLGVIAIIFLMAVFLIIVIVVASILIGMFFTGLVGGTVLLITGKHFSKDTRKKVASRICIGVGIAFFALAASSAGLLVHYAISIFG
ncbi:hypothetical protein [Butyrivibrio sp. XBB1001]|uniref:hypothetical protein n=1 Tax=Butyrivibrio sp. XBB1001 TaxID=1280682 RepID=UPI0004040EF3|nr:hypothetical protein [Butyrivibrio sp. XBB1001]